MLPLTLSIVLIDSDDDELKAIDAIFKVISTLGLDNDQAYTVLDYALNRYKEYE